MTDQMPAPGLVPPDAAPVAPAAKKHTIRNLGCGCGALLVLLVIIAVAAGGNKTTSSPQSTASPVPTTNPAAAYANLVGPLSTKLGASLTAAGKSCGSPDQKCIDAEKTALADVETFKQAIDSNAPPPCLQAASTLIRDGLTLMSAGITKQIQGIQAQDAANIDAGTSDVTSGNDKITQATTALTSAKC